MRAWCGSTRRRRLAEAGTSRPADLRIAGLSVWCLRRPFADSAEAWDRDVIEAVARVEAPGAMVELRGNWLRGMELAAFTESVAAVHRDLRGSARLSCLEPGLAVTLEVGKLGHVALRVDITPDQFTQSHSFSFGALDQTDLPALLAALRALLRRVPPISPN